ncbi:DNA repair protein Rad9, putative [Leishmania donovani]|uniref:DNA repair protein Rad9, putative n=1 Tax=Leishmania donovani TaxID=5661 RepID=A0A3Q8IIS7_LEIDO|nr:DNA repair protein Rad9, putative [Leishmania donovani]
MSLQFTVSGPNIRVLLSVLTCVSRLGDAVYIVGLSDGIEISAVSPSRNGHIAVRVHERCFDRFLLELPSRRSGADDGSGLATSHAAAEGRADDASADGPKPYLCLLTKTLVATVLRQHNTNVQSLDFQYRTAKSSDSAAAAAAAAAASDAGNYSSDADHCLWKGRTDADVVRWHCTYGRSLTKTFLLRLAEGEPTSVYADLSRYRFEVCGDARAYGSLLASLPSSANQCALTLPESGGLELRSVRQSGSSSSSSSAAAAAASGRESGSAAAPSGSIRAADGSSTVVTAFESTFTLFRFFERAASPSATDADGAAAVTESGPSEVPQTPFPNTPPPPPQQQQQLSPRRNSVLSAPDHASSATVTADFIPLPGKTFDVKPFKNAAWLAEQLGVQLHLLTGEESVPIIIASITPEEVQKRRITASADAARHESLPGTGGAAARPFLVTNSAPSVPASAFVSFILYVAALDSAPSGGRASGSGGAPGGAADTSIATAISSAVNTPRPSTHHRALKGDGGALAAVAATPIPGHGDGENGERDGMPVSSGNSTTSGTLSHVEASFVSTSAATAAAGVVGRLSRESNSTVDSAYATPRRTASPSELVMVMTGGDTPGTCSGDAGGVHAARKSVDFLTGVTASSLPGNPTVAMTGAALPSASLPLSHTPTATALSSMYPLDFEAFVRTYTSANEADDEAGEEDAQDAELREFLASCVASMSRGPTQN